uniref:Uncharacterized protein n=1 Tax=viral metagenome TaxID=1070528 RepID=A0A6M3Y3F3_9ZZZZ
MDWDKELEQVQMRLLLRKWEVKCAEAKKRFLRGLQCLEKKGSAVTSPSI